MQSLTPVLSTLDTIIADIEAALSPSGPPSKPSYPKQPRKKKVKPQKNTQPSQPVDPVVSQFLQCDLRVGRIVDVSSHPEADGLYVLQVSYGEEKRTVCAGLRKYILEEEMQNRMVVTICNLKPRKLRGVQSEAMILAGSVKGEEGQKDAVVPLMPPAPSAEGDKVTAEGVEGEPSGTGKYVNSKTWDKVVARLGVKDGQACYNGAALKTNAGVVLCGLEDGAEIH